MENCGEGKPMATIRQEVPQRRGKGGGGERDTGWHGLAVAGTQALQETSTHR